MISAAALIRREFISQLRHRTAFRGVVVLMLPLIALLCAMMYLSNLNPRLGTGAVGGIFYFRFYVIGLYLAAVLMAATLGALAIAGEREQDTYTLLQMTGMGPHAIILGKLMGALGLCTLTLVATLPLFGLQFFFVGIETRQFLGALGIIAATTLSAATCGLARSARSQRTVSVIAHTLLRVVLVNGGILGILVLAYLFVDPNVFLMVNYWLIGSLVIHALCPPLALISISGFYQLEPLLAILLLHGLWMARNWHRCARQLRRPLEETSVLVQEPPEAANGEPGPRSPGKNRRFPDRCNPIAIKERMESVLALRRNAGKLFLGTAAAGLMISFLILISGPNGDAETMFYYVGSGLFLLLAPALVAPTFAREHVYGNLDALRTTLLSPAEILRGKLVAAARTLAIVLGALIVGALPVFIERMHDRGSLDYALTTGLTLIVTAGYVLSLSTLASCTSSNPRQGLVRAYVLMLCVLWVFPLTLGFVFTTLYLYRPPDWVDHIACLSPYLSQALNFQQNRYAMLNLHWAVNAGTFVVVAYVLYRVALFRFRRRYYFGAPYPTTLHSGKSAVHAVQEAVASARMTERHYD